MPYIRKRLDFQSKETSRNRAEWVGRVPVYLAVARDSRRVELFRVKADTIEGEGRWNGQAVTVIRDLYREIEQSLSDTRTQWAGGQFEEWTKLQKKTTVTMW